MIGAAFCGFGLAAVVGWASGRPGAPATRRAASAAAVSWLLGMTGSVLLVIVGARALAGTTVEIGLGTLAELGPASVRVDALAGLFLVITFGAAIPTQLAALARGAAARPRLPAAVALTLAATALVIVAGDIVVLLAGWELIGFAFYLVVAFDRDRRGRADAAALTLVFSTVSGAGVLLGGLMVSAQAGSIAFSGWRHGTGPLAAAGYLLLVVGFAVKVGLVPAHLWLPASYSAAPGPARAILAGAAVNAGFYGLWRTVGLLGAPPVWLASGLLVTAGIAAVLGIAHAAVHADLAGMISWSSVENAGLILTGLGVAMVGMITGSRPLTAVGLLAGAAQIVAHAAAKSLLFVSTSAIEDAHGTTDLEHLGGVAHRLPFAGTGLVVGSLTLAGMPLTAGFASEWLILEALMQQFRVHNLALQLCLATAGVLVALSVGVAGITFVRLVALTAFGPRRRAREGDAPERLPVGASAESGWAFRAGLATLALACLGLAAAAPLEVRVIASGLSPIVGDAASGALAAPLILQPVFGDFSALSPTLLWVVIPGYGLLTVLLLAAASGRRFVRVRRVPVWTSAASGIPDNHGYTSYGFANPIRRVLASLLLTRAELRRHDVSEIGAPGAAGARRPILGYTIDVVDIVEQYLYRPFLPWLRALVRAARGLQSGRLDAYMAYMLVAVLAVIAVVTAMAGR